MSKRTVLVLVLGLALLCAGVAVVYVLSLDAGSSPETLAPKDPVPPKPLGERELATDARLLFGISCSACHGLLGEGRRFGQPEVFFPAIGHVDFLAVADDALIRRTILDGRPGTFMPAWGTMDGGLLAPEVELLVRYIRSLEPPAPKLEAVLAATPDLALGRRLFGDACTPCHGAAGEGSVLGPPLAAPDNEITKDERRMYDTLTNGVAGSAMGRFRTYDASSLRALMAAIRSLPPQGKRAGWKSRTGKAKVGQGLYIKHCTRCHGAPGPGTGAPALKNKAFLAAASEEYIVATIIRGRGETMPRFGAPGKDHPRLTPEEVADIVASLTAESWDD